MVRLSSNNKNSEFYGSVISLGSLGIITKVYLDLVPFYKMRQIAYKELSLENFKITLMKSLNTVAVLVFLLIGIKRHLIKFGSKKLSQMIGQYQLSQTSLV